MDCQTGQLTVPFVGRSSIVTRAAASRAAVCRSFRPITSITGHAVRGRSASIGDSVLSLRPRSRFDRATWRSQRGEEAECRHRRLEVEGHSAGSPREVGWQGQGQHGHREHGRHGLRLGLPAPAGLRGSPGIADGALASTQRGLMGDGEGDARLRIPPATAPRAARDAATTGSRPSPRQPAGSRSPPPATSARAGLARRAGRRPS